MLEKEHFDALYVSCTRNFDGSSSLTFPRRFAGKGILIQPTPTNKPGSAVTIIHVTGHAELESIFGDELLKPLKGERWNIGGVLVPS